MYQRINANIKGPGAVFFLSEKTRLEGLPECHLTSQYMLRISKLTTIFHLPFFENKYGEVYPVFFISNQNSFSTSLELEILNCLLNFF